MVVVVSTVGGRPGAFLQVRDVRRRIHDGDWFV